VTINFRFVLSSGSKRIDLSQHEDGFSIVSTSISPGTLVVILYALVEPPLLLKLEFLHT
jgi:hypothetical protein